MNADQFFCQLQDLSYLYPKKAFLLVIYPKTNKQNITIDPILDLLNRYDASEVNISLFCLNDKFEDMNLLEPDDNDRFNEMYYWLGSYSECWLVISKISNEIMIVSEDDPFLEGEIDCVYVAKNGSAF